MSNVHKFSEKVSSDRAGRLAEKEAAIGRLNRLIVGYEAKVKDLTALLSTEREETALLKETTRELETAVSDQEGELVALQARLNETRGDYNKMQDFASEVLSELEEVKNELRHAEDAKEEAEGAREEAEKLVNDRFSEVDKGLDLLTDYLITLGLPSRPLSFPSRELEALYDYLDGQDF